MSTTSFVLKSGPSPAAQSVGQRLRGGQNVSREFGGGETYCRVCSPKPLLEASEIGVGLVGASFF